MHRIFKFYSVGTAGVGIQLAVLFVLTHLMGLNYLPATFLAVESAILHNFFWHCRWTFKPRLTSAGARRLTRLLRFHLTSGASSLLGNLLIMRLLVEELAAPVLPANLAAIACCALFNYLAADLWVFRQTRFGLHGPKGMT